MFEQVNSIRIEANSSHNELLSLWKTPIQTSLRIWNAPIKYSVTTCIIPSLIFSRIIDLTLKIISYSKGECPLSFWSLQGILFFTLLHFFFCFELLCTLCFCLIHLFLACLSIYLFFLIMPKGEKYLCINLLGNIMIAGKSSTS